MVQQATRAMTSILHDRRAGETVCKFGSEYYVGLGCFETLQLTEFQQKKLHSILVKSLIPRCHAPSLSQQRSR
ncbi:hypothetical protein [Phormidesmis priestleyi]